MKTVIATLFAAAIVLPAAAAGGHHRTLAVDYPGAQNTQIYALNDARQFVGSEQASDGVWHAMFDDGSGLATLDLSPLGADVTHSFAFSINTQADIAGAFRNTTGYHGFLRHADGSFEVIDYPGGHDTQDYGVNDHGEVIGMYTDADGVAHAFRRVDGKLSTIDLPDALETVPLSVNNAGQIAGEMVKTAGTAGYGYVQRADGSFELFSNPAAPPESTFFISINNRGEILGAYLDTDGVQHNFLRRGSKYLPVDLPASFGASYTSAQTINDGDDVVGFYDDADGASHGVTSFGKP
jgi:probable HAF family extracellular repeat protein